MFVYIGHQEIYSDAESQITWQDHFNFLSGIQS